MPKSILCSKCKKKLIHKEGLCYICFLIKKREEREIEKKIGQKSGQKN